MPSSFGPYEFAISLIACVGGVISTSEWLSNSRQLQDDGLFSWAVFRTRGAIIRPQMLERSLESLVAHRSFISILALRLVALLCLPTALWFRHGAAPILAVIFLTSLLMHFRCPFGMDGSDQMLTQIFGGLLMGQLSGSTLGHNAALWFIAAQACLSYFTSGIAKAMSPHWRDGKVVFAIFNTRTYGYEPAARWLIHSPTTTRVLGLGAVYMECVFPISILVGFPVCLLFIAWGVAFHLMNAVVMGLNSFFWSFVATYPAVIYCAIGLAAILRPLLSVSKALHFPYGWLLGAN
jgi:hypothetical protein